MSEVTKARETAGRLSAGVILASSLALTACAGTAETNTSQYEDSVVQSNLLYALDAVKTISKTYNVTADSDAEAVTYYSRKPSFPHNSATPHWETGLSPGVITVKKSADHTEFYFTRWNNDGPSKTLSLVARGDHDADALVISSFTFSEFDTKGTNVWRPAMDLSDVNTRELSVGMNDLSSIIATFDVDSNFIPVDFKK